jgi:hypothetical protein
MKRGLCHWSVILLFSGFALLSGTRGALDLRAADAKDAPANLGPYEVIVDKDLFDSERGATEEDASEEDVSSPAEELNKKYQVYGAIIAGEMRQAFVKVVEERKPGRPSRKGSSSSKDEELRTVTVGDLMDGWRVAEITPDGVELTGLGERVHLGIFDAVKADRKATGPVAMQTPQPEPEPVPSPVPIGGVGSPVGAPGSPAVAAGGAVGAAGSPAAQRATAQGRPPIRPAVATPRHTVQRTPPFQPASGAAADGSSQTVQSIFGGGVGAQQQGEGSEQGGTPPVITPSSQDMGTNPFLELLKRQR